MSITWKAVPPHISTEHEISSDGQVRRSADAKKIAPAKRKEKDLRGFILKQSHKAGYPSVSINGVSHYVHRLLCETFHGPKPAEGFVVRHLDDDKHNITLDNICWGTPQQNRADAIKNGATYKRRTDIDMTTVRAHRERGLTLVDISSLMDIPETTLRSRVGRDGLKGKAANLNAVIAALKTAAE